MSDTSRYTSPLSGRYASDSMLRLFSQDNRIITWRKLWVALAEAEKELGLNITDQQIKELKDNLYDINYEDAAEKEREIRHDVMAHVYAYGLKCPNAKGIIHLGATSCYVTDNADLIIYKSALKLIRDKLVKAIENLSRFALKHADTACMGYTHFQPAQPVTVGKRATLWVQDLMLDLKDLIYVMDSLKLLGSKGTTGTQASFLSLFDGDENKVSELDKKIAEKMGFDETYPVSGQTYPRKEDSRILNVLSGIAQSAHRFGTDIRLLQSTGELEEPFEDTQVGSSAMAYKRNPMRSERICSLSRFITASSLNPQLTASVQWLERSLDDSANRRISIPEAFLAADAVLSLVINVSEGLVVNRAVIERRLNDNLPFFATENILMTAVKKGGDRQLLHERIRVHSMQAAKRMKQEGTPCDLIERIAADDFGLSREELKNLLDPKLYTGLAEKQTRDYIEKTVLPFISSIETDDIEISINV